MKPLTHSLQLLEVLQDLVESGVDLQTQFESYRNFPVGRGFNIVLSTASGRWKASDGQSEYWLNTTNNRWICMDGPDLDLPQKDDDV